MTSKLDWLSCAILGAFMTVLVGALLFVSAVVLDWPVPDLESTLALGFFIWVLVVVELRYPTPYWW